MILQNLSSNQIFLLENIIQEFKSPIEIVRYSEDPWFTESVLHKLGDTLKIHHSLSHEPLAKERFEFALERALNNEGIFTSIQTNRTFRGKDISIGSQRINLKTEYAQDMCRDRIHITKWMSMGNKNWDIANLKNLFLNHLEQYDRIFVLRAYPTDGEFFHYELIEIPKSLVLEIGNYEMEFNQNSDTNPPTASCRVLNEQGDIKYRFSILGGSSCFIRVGNIRRQYCIPHADWKFKLNVP